MRRVIFFAALLISGSIGLAITVALIVFGIVNFITTLLAVIFVIFILVGLIGGALSVIDDRHDKRC